MASRKRPPEQSSLFAVPAAPKPAPVEYVAQPVSGLELQTFEPPMCTPHRHTLVTGVHDERCTICGRDGRLIAITQGRDALKPAPSADEPHDSPVVAERTVRLVHSVPLTQVIVEPDGPGHFVVSLLRHHGTTVAAVRYSRSMLEQLVAKAKSALGES